MFLDGNKQCKSICLAETKNKMQKKEWIGHSLLKTLFIFKELRFSTFIYVYVSVWMYLMCVGAHGSQKRIWEPPSTGLTSGKPSSVDAGNWIKVLQWFRYWSQQGQTVELVTSWRTEEMHTPHIPPKTLQRLLVKNLTTNAQTKSHFWKRCESRSRKSHHGYQGCT